MESGDSNNVSRLSMGSHTGTHVDAPLHFIGSGKSLDQMPLDTMLGPARVIPIRDPRRIRCEELKQHRVRRGERILFRTRNSPRCWRESAFVKDFVSLSLEAAEMLAQRRVRMVGVDYLSVGGYRDEDGVAVHEALLGAGIWIIEGLDLSQVPPGPCELICLPLKVLGGDGAPARAIVRPKGRRRSPAGGSS
jgi:arylformamidase